MVAPIYKHLFVLTYSHLCFNVSLPPSFSLTEQQHPVCYWSNIMIKGAVCCTKNRPAIQLCYPAVHCSRQVVSFLPPGRLGQVQMLIERGLIEGSIGIACVKRLKCKMKWKWNENEMKMKWKWNENEMKMKWKWNENEMKMKWKWNENEMKIIPHKPQLLLQSTCMYRGFFLHSPRLAQSKQFLLLSLHEPWKNENKN